MERQTKEDRVVSSKNTNYVGDIEKYPMVHFVSFNEPNYFTRKNLVMELDKLPGESRGYLKYHDPTRCLDRLIPSVILTTIAPICCLIKVPKYIHTYIYIYI